MTIKSTQTISDENAQQALTYLAGVLGLPQSRILEALLCAAPPAALSELLKGSRSLTGVRLVTLDVPEQLAVMDAIAAGVRMLSERLTDAVREGVKEELHKANIHDEEL